MKTLKTQLTTYQVRKLRHRRVKCLLPSDLEVCDWGAMISHKPEESFISELLPKESVRRLSIAAQIRVRRKTAQVEEG